MTGKDETLLNKFEKAGELVEGARRRSDCPIVAGVQRYLGVERQCLQDLNQEGGCAPPSLHRDLSLLYRAGPTWKTVIATAGGWAVAACLAVWMFSLNAQLGAERRQNEALAVFVQDFERIFQKPEYLPMKTRDPAVAQAWVGKKFDPELAPVKLEDSTLKGAGICRMRNGRAAAYFYECKGKLVGVFILPKPDIRPGQGQLGDLTYKSWRKGRLTYVRVEKALPS